jgi:hypothetical protein
MANTFKKVIDRMMWIQTPPAPNAHAAAGMLCSDLRNDISRNPYVFQLVGNTTLNRYNIVTKAWAPTTSPALAGTFGAGACSVFAPSRGVEGTIAAGATTTSVVLTTALPTAVGLNMLASRGGSGDYGFKIRIIGKGSGKTEERFIVGNTASATPTITVDTAFTFTPASGDGYELLGGRVFMLGASTLAANIWRSFEVATNTLSSGLSTTNLPATIGTDTDLLCLDEQYTPYNCLPGEGMVKGAFTYDTVLTVARMALAATATGASSLTGQAALGDAVVVANEFRNFQIRIVQDTTTPTANGQRRQIASHTGGASPVYTLGAAWTVQPSATAKYVIELPNLIIGRSTATTSVYTYNYSPDTYNNGTTSLATSLWSTTLFAAAGAAAIASGMWMPSWGIQPDPARNARNSFCYFWRGNGSAALDVLDIAGGTTGAWSAGVTYDGSPGNITTGSCGTLSPFDNEGRMFYMNIYTASTINQIYRFDVKNRVLSPYAPTDTIQAGASAVGKRMAAYCAIDGTDEYAVVLLLNHLSTINQELIPLV